MSLLSRSSDPIITLLVFALAVMALIAWVLSISFLVDAAKEKGFRGGAGTLWFIGLFTTLIILGLIVAAWPDRRASAVVRSRAAEAPQFNDLPDL